MSKPLQTVTLTSTDQRQRRVPALFDSGSFYTIVREDCLPSSKAVLRYKVPRQLGTASKGGKVTVVGVTFLVIGIGKKKINESALVAKGLSREMIIGAGAMQAWDITLHNRNGSTRVHVGHDMRDPEITEVI